MGQELKANLLDQLLRESRSPVHIDRILQELRCSEKTFYRVRRRLEEMYHGEIEHVGDQYYRYNKTEHEYFPGLFFTHREIDALICFNNALNSLQAGILDEIMQPFKAKLLALLEDHDIDEQAWNTRIKMIPLAQRKIDPEIFRTLAGAVLHNRRCIIGYKGLSDETVELREISPQTMLRYRDNWYVDAWCHAHSGLRTFAVSRVFSVEQLTTDSIGIDRSQLDQHYTTSYGIFNGKPTETAVIHFTGIAAQEIAHQEWHPAQKTEWINGTTLRLTIPYCDATELTMDILRWGDMAEVIAPPLLREKMRGVFERGARKYA